jgi:YVTN family beta-propeller protein
LMLLLGFVASGAPAAPFVYVTQPASIAVIDAATNSVTATIPAGDFPYAIAITRSGARGYTADFASNTVTFLDLLGNNAMATVPVAAEPLALALSRTAGGFTSCMRARRSSAFSIRRRTHCPAPLPIGSTCCQVASRCAHRVRKSMSPINSCAASSCRRRATS